MNLGRSLVYGGRGVGLGNCFFFLFLNTIPMMDGVMVSLATDAVQLAVSTKSREFTRGQEVVLECKVIGDLQLNYWVFWRYNGSRIDEQTAVAYQLEVTGSPPVYTLRILQANESHEGVYWCVAGSTFRAEEASDTVELSLGGWSLVWVGGA